MSLYQLIYSLLTRQPRSINLYQFLLMVSDFLPPIFCFPALLRIETLTNNRRNKVRSSQAFQDAPRFLPDYGAISALACPFSTFVYSSQKSNVSMSHFVFFVRPRPCQCFVSFDGASFGFVFRFSHLCFISLGGVWFPQTQG